MGYCDIVARINAIAGSERIGFVGKDGNEFPFHRITRGQGKDVLLLGGVHGNEPAGVHSVLEFFEKHSSSYEDKFRFTAFPCVNPWGYENDSRGNAFGINLNRDFKKPPESQEMKLMLPTLGQYLFAMDFHETWFEPNQEKVGSEPEGPDATEFYFWEVCPDKSLRVGEKILENIAAAGIPICKWPEIYGDKNNGGVIWYPEGQGSACYAEGTASDAYLNKYHTPHSFTVETFREFPMEKRTLAHIITLKTTLDEKIKLL